MKKCCLVHEVDRISSLPDPIRSHIVSFLPMNDAIRTSILSRRWEHICSSLSNLEFDQSSFETKMRKKGDFRDFVDEMIFRHDGSDVQRFSLKTDVGNAFISPRRVNAWISFAVQHNVQDFELWKYSKKIEKLPSRFFTCNKLKVLRLVSVKIEWPPIVKFPMLKSFTLENVTFDNENRVNKLFSSCTCPVLEDLLIICCYLDIKTLSISNPSLKYLKVFDGNDIVFNVSIPTLRDFDYMCYQPPNISSENLSSLSTANFDILQEFNSNDIETHSQYNCASKILTGLHNVLTLSLMSGFIEFLSRERDLLACLPSSYCSLKHLELQMLPTRIHVQVITLLFRTYPNVQTLLMHIEGIDEETSTSNIIDMDEYLQLKELPPGDILNHLRTVEIKNFEGSESELDLVRYLLRNAKFLEKMNISYLNKKREDVDCKMRTSEILSTCTRVSSSVAISLS